MPRVVNIPRTIPLRIVRMIVVSFQDLGNKVSQRCHVVIEMSAEKRRDLVNFAANTSQQAQEKLSSARSTTALALKDSREKVTKRAQAAVVWVGDGAAVVATRAKLPEAKEWTVEKASGVKLTASLVVDEAALRAFEVASRVAGVDRAAGAFQRVGQYIPAAQKAVKQKRH